MLLSTSISTQAYENVHSYAGFDGRLGDTLGTVRAKELNLMLHDLVRSHDLAIVDADAMAAELGMLAHLPDGVHQSGALQAEVRGELLHILRSRGFPGFAARTV
jgi:hypothetical protein